MNRPTAALQPLHAQASLASQKKSTAVERTAAIEKTREILEAYWQKHDPGYVAAAPSDNNISTTLKFHSLQARRCFQ